MARPRVAVLTGFGINCDYETQAAFSAAGADSQRVHINSLLSGVARVGDYHLLAFPGGFSFGDDLGSGKVLANKFKYNLRPELENFLHSGKLIIGICNGFQCLVKLGLLPAQKGAYFTQAATLSFNDSGKFEDRWIRLKINPASPCVFTRGMDFLSLPVRHGEGKFVWASESVHKNLVSSNAIVAQYVDEAGTLAGYPSNPNGSLDNIAGICDETGRVFGLMPHPEAFIERVLAPSWTRRKRAGNYALDARGEGFPIFANAVKYAQERLL